MQKERVGFFGGSFNPPTNVHINLAKNLVKDKIVEKVIFVPVGDYYSKKDLIPANYRYTMLKLACNEIEFLEVEKIPLEKAVDMVLSGEIKDGKTQALVMRVAEMKRRGIIG